MTDQWRDFKTDPPPDELSSIIGCQMSEGDHQGLVAQCFKFGGDEDGGVWIGYSGLAPTHWMPLPQPPTIKE